MACSLLSYTSYLQVKWFTCKSIWNFGSKCSMKIRKHATDWKCGYNHLFCANKKIFVKCIVIAWLLRSKNISSRNLQSLKQSNHICPSPPTRNRAVWIFFFFGFEIRNLKFSLNLMQRKHFLQQYNKIVESSF